MTDTEWKAAVESRLRTLEQTSAADTVHKQMVEQRLTGIEQKQTQQLANQQRLVWLVIAALVTAFLEFVVKGGLGS